jgi:Spy/CpxP family protein refolding chaperone
VNSWKVILATMVIFGTGVVTGGLLVRHTGPARDRRPARNPGATHPTQLSPAGVMRFEFLRRMQQELDLKPEQREQMDRVLKDGQERMKKLTETIEPRRREEYKKTVEAFRTVLTPEQQERFDEIVKQQQQRAREQRKATPPREHPQQTPPPAAPAGATNT